MTYTREFVPTVNDPDATAAALTAARSPLGEANVILAGEPGTGFEDFARLLQHAPGCYAFIGNGEGSVPAHHPEFDFNDDQP